MEEKKDSFDFRFLNKLMYISTFIIVFYLLKSIGILDKITIVIKALIPVLLGIVICYFAMPLVNRLKKLGLSKNISAILSLIIIFGIIIILISVVTPMFIDQVTNLIKELPNIYTKITEMINGFITEKFGTNNKIMISDSIKNLDIVKNLASNALNYVVSTLQNVISIVITIGTAIVVSFFIIKDMDKIKENMIMFLSKNKKNSKRYKMLQEIDITVMSYVKGIIIDSFVVGLLTVIVCLVLGLDYAFIFGILIMILNLIPYIGALLSYTIASLYALSVGGPIYAIVVFIALFLVQMVDANILQPNIIAKSVDLHPVVVLAGLIIFQLLFGIIGMIIAVPILAVIKIVLKYKFDFNEKIKDDDIDLEIKKETLRKIREN